MLGVLNTTWYKHCELGILSIISITSSVSHFFAVPEPMLWFGVVRFLWFGCYTLCCLNGRTEHWRTERWMDILFNSYVLDLHHTYSRRPKRFKTTGLHRNPVVNVVLPLNLLMQRPLPKLLAVTNPLSLLFFFLFLPSFSSSSCFWGSRTKTNGFSDVTWVRSWFREWWLIANLTYRDCHITPEIWWMDIFWITFEINYSNRNMVNGNSFHTIWNRT